jgi:DNA uptake protein ComE-like DNA-binding protein
VTLAILWAAVTGLSVASAYPERPPLHQMSLEQLDALPGVGPKTALAIVVSIQEHGPFHSWSELEQIEGVGAGLLAAIRARTKLPESTAERAPDRTRPLIDPNVSTAAMLTGWPSVSLNTASRIVAFRDHHGFFSQCRDMIQVPGMGPATVALLAHQCKIDP